MTFEEFKNTLMLGSWDPFSLKPIIISQRCQEEEFISWIYENIPNISKLYYKFSGGSVFVILNHDADLSNVEFEEVTDYIPTIVEQLPDEGIV